MVGRAIMHPSKFLAMIILTLSVGSVDQAAELPGTAARSGGGSRGPETAVEETALIGAGDKQIGVWPDAFCEALTSEQLGFAIDTLSAQLLDGVPIKSQAESFIAKLRLAQNRLTPKNITAVFDQLEDFIVRVDTLTKSGKLPMDQGDLLINSILGVVCRT